MKFVIPVLTYGVQIRVYAHRRKAKLLRRHNKCLKNRGSSPDEEFADQAYCYSLYSNKEHKQCIDIVFDKAYVSINTIAHEAIHAVFYITEHVGLKLCDDSEEAFSYLMGYVMEELFKGLGKLCRLDLPPKRVNSP